jgi:hypothetical protein
MYVPEREAARCLAYVWYLEHVRDSHRPAWVWATEHWPEFLPAVESDPTGQMFLKIYEDANKEGGASP